MIRLVPEKRRLPEGSPRLWLVFFGEAAGGAWWSKFFRPGFRHVAVAAYFDDQERWIYYDPSCRGTCIEIYAGSEFDAKLEHLAAHSAAVLRVPSRFARGGTPAVWHCVGAIKALLGVRCRALTPFGLFRHLCANGAEIVEVPSRVRPVRRKTAVASTGGSGGDALAPAGTATG